MTSRTRILGIPFACLGSVALVGVLSGCASTPEGRNVRVEARHNTTAKEGISYRLRAANPDNETDSLRYQEVSNFVKTALSGHGMHEAVDGKSADIIVDLDFGVTAPGTRHEIVRLPVYRTIPGRSEASVFIAGINSRGEDQVIRHRHREPDRKVLVGHRDHPFTNPDHERFLKLTARETRPDPEGSEPAEVWSIEVRTRGDDDDLREDLPVLAAAAVDFIKKDSRGRVVVRVDENDPSVDFVKGGR